MSTPQVTKSISPAWLTSEARTAVKAMAASNTTHISPAIEKRIVLPITD